MSQASRHARLADLVDHAAHLLPIPGAYNPLRAFEHLPFDAAVVVAAGRLGIEPYLCEAAYAAHVLAGRVGLADIDAVLAAEPGVSDQAPVAGGPTRRELWRLRLLHPVAPDASIAAEWVAVLAPHAPRLPPPPVGKRPRDVVRAETGLDVDAWIHPLLQPLLAASSTGLLTAFRGRTETPEPWLAGLAADLHVQTVENWSAEKTCVAALERMDVAPDDWEAVVEATLFALGERPVWPELLLDFLAVRLTLEVQAVAFARRLPAQPLPASVPYDHRVVQAAAAMAKLANLTPAALAAPETAAAWLAEVAALDGYARRRLLHRAYERHHHVRVLDDLWAPRTPAAAGPFASRLQAGLAKLFGRNKADPEPRVTSSAPAVFVLGRRPGAYGQFYDPASDVDGRVLAALIAATVPRCVGLNLSAFFGPRSAGHESVRLLYIVEATPDRVSECFATLPVVARLAKNLWMHVVTWQPEIPAMQIFDGQAFTPYEPARAGAAR